MNTKIHGGSDLMSCIFIDPVKFDVDQMVYISKVIQYIAPMMASFWASVKALTPEKQMPEISLLPYGLYILGFYILLSSQLFYFTAYSRNSCELCIIFLCFYLAFPSLGEKKFNVICLICQ